MPQLNRSHLDRTGPDESPNPTHDEVLMRLHRIEQQLEQLLRTKAVKDWYTTAEVAAIVGKAEFTVREWCRLRRVSAEKRPCGRGAAQEWIVSHEELTRLRNEGLLPDPLRYRHPR